MSSQYVVLHSYRVGKEKAMAKNQIVALMFEEVEPGLMHETEASL